MHKLGKKLPISSPLLLSAFELPPSPYCECLQQVRMASVLATYSRWGWWSMYYNSCRLL